MEYRNVKSICVLILVIWMTSIFKTINAQVTLPKILAPLGEHTDPDDTTNFSLAKLAGCGVYENHAPLVTEHTPIKYLRVAIHVSS